MRSMRWLFMGVVVVLAACEPLAGTPKPASPVVAQPAVAGTVVGTGALRKDSVIGHYLVLVPDAADANAAERAARAIRVPSDVDVTLELLPTAEVAYILKLLVGNDILQRDRPEVTRTQRVLRVLVIGPAGKIDDVMYAAAACVRASAAAGHGWIVDLHTMGLFTLDAFRERRPDGFSVSADALVMMRIGTDKRTDTAYLETSGLRSFGLPELRMHGIPVDLREGFTEMIRAAAQTLIDRGALARPGLLEVDLHTLTVDAWPDHAAAVSAAGGTGKVTFTAIWLEADRRHGPGRIELGLPGGTTAERARAALTAYFPPPETYDALTPEIEATAQRARAELVALAPYFASGIPAGELLVVKVALPLRDNADVAEWLWLPVTSLKPDEVKFFVPEEFRPHMPAYAGQGFRVPVWRILDYRHIRADRSQVGGATDRFQQTKPGARIRIGK